MSDSIDRLDVSYFRYEYLIFKASAQADTDYSNWIFANLLQKL